MEKKIKISKKFKKILISPNLFQSALNQQLLIGRRIQLKNYI